VCGLRQPKKSELPLKLSVLCILSYSFCRRTPTTPDFGVWVEGKQGSKEGTFLAHGSEGIMKDIWQHNRKDTNEVNPCLPSTHTPKSGVVGVLRLFKKAPCSSMTFFVYRIRHARGVPCF
jgi:hypothetical protein